MEWIGTLLASFFGSGLIALGYGARQNREIGRRKGVGKWLIAGLYLTESMLLGLLGWALRSLGAKNDLLLVLAPLLAVVTMVVCLGVFQTFKRRAFPASWQAAIGEDWWPLALNSALLATLLLVVWLDPSASIGRLLATIFFLPLGYLASSFVFDALDERIRLSPAPRGFRGWPLLLLCFAGFAIAASSLSF